MLGDEEQREQHEAGREQDELLRRGPRVRVPTQAGEQDHRRQPAGEQRDPEPVDLVPHLVHAGVEDRADHPERDRADRQVDVEDPAPGEVVDEEAADQRPDHARNAEDRAEEALVAAALAGRDDVADHGDRGHDQPARAEALDRTEGNQLDHPVREPAQRRAGEEEHDRRLEDELAPVEVAELPVQRARHGRREQVRRHDPRHVRRAAEVADDRRQRGRDDRLVERGEQQHEQERSEDDADAGRLWAHAALRRWYLERSASIARSSCLPASGRTF